MSCKKCHPYFMNYVEDRNHPRMAETGTEGRCALCGLYESVLHQQPYQKCDCQTQEKIMGHKIDTSNSKTKVFVEPFGRTNTFSIWPVDEKGEKVGSFPIVSFGLKKAEAIAEHFEEMKEYIKGQKK